MMSGDLDQISSSSMTEDSPAVNQISLFAGIKSYGEVLKLEVVQELKGQPVNWSIRQPLALLVQ